MNRRLIYVMGPSGAGKDSVLGWLRERVPRHAPVHWAVRTVTRPRQSGGEQHETVDAATFEALLQQQRFALAWEANGLRYGIPHEELGLLQRGGWVMVNGSRGYLDDAARQFPGMTVVHITARAQTLRKRLIARGRESECAVHERIARAEAFEGPPGAIEVSNDGALEQAGQHLLLALQQLPGWALAPETQDNLQTQALRP